MRIDKGKQKALETVPSTDIPILSKRLAMSPQEVAATHSKRSRKGSRTATATPAITLDIGMPPASPSINSEELDHRGESPFKKTLRAANKMLVNPSIGREVHANSGVTPVATQTKPNSVVLLSKPPSAFARTSGHNGPPLKTPFQPALNNSNIIRSVAALDMRTHNYTTGPLRYVRQDPGILQDPARFARDDLGNQPILLTMDQIAKIPQLDPGLQAALEQADTRYQEQGKEAFFAIRGSLASVSPAQLAMRVHLIHELPMFIRVQLIHEMPTFIRIQLIHEIVNIIYTHASSLHLYLRYTPDRLRQVHMAVESPERPGRPSQDDFFKRLVLSLTSLAVQEPFPDRYIRAFRNQHAKIYWSVALFTPQALRDPNSCKEVNSEIIPNNEKENELTDAAFLRAADSFVRILREVWTPNKHAESGGREGIFMAEKYSKFFSSIVTHMDFSSNWPALRTYTFKLMRDEVRLRANHNVQIEEFNESVYNRIRQQIRETEDAKFRDTVEHRLNSMSTASSSYQPKKAYSSSRSNDNSFRSSYICWLCGSKEHTFRGHTGKGKHLVSVKCGDKSVWVDPEDHNTTFCIAFNGGRGCTRPTCSHKHACSLCGSPKAGAQTCSCTGPPKQQ